MSAGTAYNPSINHFSEVEMSCDGHMTGGSTQIAEDRLSTDATWCLAAFMEFEDPYDPLRPG